MFVCFFFFLLWYILGDFLPRWLTKQLNGKESACQVGDLCSIPGLGRSPGEGKGYPLQYSGLENSMDYIAHGDAKSWTELNDFHLGIFYVDNHVIHK